MDAKSSFLGVVNRQCADFFCQAITISYWSTVGIADDNIIDVMVSNCDQPIPEKTRVLAEIGSGLNL